MDTLVGFLDECCVLSPLAKVLLKDLYVEYCKWATRNGESEISQRALNSQIAERGYKQKRGAKGVRSWIGIGLMAEQFAGGDRTDCHPVTPDDDFCHPGQVIEMADRKTASVGVVTKGDTNSPVIQSEKNLALEPGNSVTLCHPEGNCPNTQNKLGDKRGAEGGGGVTFTCSTCRFFKPSQMNPNGYGVCEGEPFDGKSIKLPGDGKECKNWQPEY